MPRILSPMARLLRILGLALLVAAPVQAQRVITFDEAIRLALTRNTDLRQAEVADHAGELNVSFARADALPLPFVSAFITPTQRYGLSFDQTTGQLVSQTSEALNLGINASVNLFDGFRNRRALEQARLQRSAGTFSLERTRQQVAFDVASRFLQLMLDEEIVGIRRGSLEAQRAQLLQIENLVDAGVRARADVFSQRAAVAGADGRLLQAGQAVELSKTRLVEVLHLDPFADYEFVAPALDGDSLTLEEVSLDALLNAAYERRADLQAQKRTIQAAETGIAVARSNRLPTIDLQAGFGTGYSSLQQRLVDPDAEPVFLPVTTENGDPVFLGGVPFEVPLQLGPELESTPIFAQFNDNRGGSIGLSISIPIFDRYQTSRQIQLAQIEVLRQELTMERLRLSVAVEVRQAVIDYRNAAAQLRVTATQIEATEAALQAEQDRYELGTGTLVALAQARAQHTEALSNRVQAVYQFVFRRKLIDFALGDLDLEGSLF